MLSDEITPTTMAGPEEGRCYRSADSQLEEEVEVVAVATVVSVHDGEKPLTMVVYRHHGSRSCLALLSDEWTARKFEPISRAQFVGETEPHARYGHLWALVFLSKGAKLREARDSREISVVRVTRVLGGADPTSGPTGGPLEAEFKHGSRFVRREPLDGVVYEFRDDARRAKVVLCEKNGIRRAGWRDHYDDCE